jgi:hypothetical protein
MKCAAAHLRYLGCKQRLGSAVNDRIGIEPAGCRTWRADDEYHLLVGPTMLYGAKRVLPGSVCVRLDLLDERRITNGMVCLRYRAPVAPGLER